MRFIFSIPLAFGLVLPLAPVPVVAAQTASPDLATVQVAARRKRRKKRPRRKAKPKKTKRQQAAPVAPKPEPKPVPEAPPKPPVLAKPASPAKDAEPSKPSIAVMEIGVSDALDSAVVKLLNERVLARMNAGNRFENVIGSSDIQAMLDLEQTRSAMGCEEESCLTELGGALGVPYLMVADIGTFAGQFIVNMKVLSVEDGKVGSRVSHCLPDALTIMTRLSDTVDQAIELALDPRAVLANNGSNTSVNKCKVPLTKKPSFWAGGGLVTASLLGYLALDVPNSELQNLKGQYDLARGEEAIDRWSDLESSVNRAQMVRTLTPLGLAGGLGLLVYALAAED